MTKHRIKMIGASTLIAAAAMVSAGPAALAAAPAQVRPPVGTTTQIVNKNSGKCLTIAGGSNADNADANQYTCDNHPARRWYFVDRGNDRYNIMNLYTGKCLTIAGGGTADNIKAVQYGCDLHPSRMWYFRY
jgi:cytolethal distending toxin subunit A